MIDLSENLLPPLSTEEEERLRASIRDNGFDPAYPIVVDEDGNVLDGWNRKRIAEELGIEPVIVVKSGLSKWEKVRLAVGRNVDRRQLDRWQVGRLAQKLLPEAEAAAAERQAATQLAGKDKAGRPKFGAGQVTHTETMEHEAAREAAAESLTTQFNPPANDATIERHRQAGRAKEEVGSLLGVSRRTVDRAVRAIEKFEEDALAAGVDEERLEAVLVDLDLGRVNLANARAVLGIGGPPPIVREESAPADRHDLIVTFINTTRTLSTGFTAEEAAEMRQLADDLLIPLRHIERLYCETRRK